MILLKNDLDRSRGFHTASSVMRKPLLRYGKRGYIRACPAIFSRIFHTRRCVACKRGVLSFWGKLDRGIGMPLPRYRQVSQNAPVQVAPNVKHTLQEF